MNKKLTLHVMFFCLLAFSLFQQASAQTKKITGFIYDDKNVPLQGAVITVKNSALSTATDVTGAFSLNALPSAKIIVTYVGYETAELPVANQTNINVTLHPLDIKMQEVVMTALGFEAKKDKLGYASSKIGGDQVANSGEAGLVDALGGKASGVRVARTSGSDPGVASQILIRGQSTITRGTDPLVVLDGLPISSGSRNESSGNTSQQSRLNDINPDDIASIQVLKGASAAALWGTKAANGVLVITTKKGSGNKTNITFKSTYSIDKVSEFYNLQSTYGQGSGGVWLANNTRSWGDKIANRSGAPDAVNTTGASFIANNGQTYYPITAKTSQEIFLHQNYDEVLSKGHYLDNSLTISAGDNKANYFFSLNDLNQSGVIQNESKYRRSGMRFNASKQMNKWLTISNKTSYSLINSDRVQTGVNNAGFMIALLRTPPDFDNSGYIGNYSATAGGAFILNRQRSYRNYLGANANPGFNNPLWDLYQLKNTSHVNRFINSSEANINPVQWLNFTVRAGLDYFTDEQVNYYPYFSTNGVTGLYNRQEYSEMQFNLDVIGRAEHNLTKDISANFLIGFNYNDQNSATLGAQSLNFIIPAGPLDLDNATPANISNTDSYLKRRSNAGYSSIGVGLYDQLFVNATGRIEAASSFGELSRSTFFYPSADVAWQFSRLNLFKNAKAFSFGKLRASFGIVGVQPQAYQTSTNFINSTTPNYIDGFGGFLDPGLYGVGTYIQSGNRGNAYLRPEKKKEYELGIDLRFFNNRLSVSVTYYQNKTTDALINISQAPSTGFNNLYANAGAIQNKGVESDLSYNIIKKKDWQVDAGINWSQNKNKVLNLSGAGSINLGGTAGISSRAVEGYPLGELYSIPWVRDSKGNLQLNANGFPIPDITSTAIGDPNPDWRGGLSFNVKYKNFSLNILIEHSQGGVVANGTEAVLLDYGVSATTGNESIAPSDLKRYDGTIIPAGTAFRGNIKDFGAGNVALEQSWYTGPGGFFGNVGEQFLEDATWTRFRELNLGYTLTSSTLHRLIGINSLKLEFGGRNLFLISNVKGYDPDSNVAGSTSARGVIYFVNPPTRSYLFTAKFNF